MLETDRRVLTVLMSAASEPPHSISDPGTYRSEQERRIWQERDPIPNHARWLREQGHADDELLAQIDAEVKQVVEDAIAFAEQSPEPEPSELWNDVYAVGEVHHG